MRHTHFRHHPRDDRRFAHGETPGESRRQTDHDEHHRGRGGRGGRVGRFFEHGDLRLVVLQLIADRPRHGYDIIKAVEELAGGAYSPSPGVIYPTLTLLEEVGHITVTPGDGARKLHTITPDGLAQLAANRTSVEAIFARIADSGPTGGPAPQILRAMGNLKLALRLRLSRDRLGEAELRTIAAAIDAAAAAVEQS